MPDFSKVSRMISWLTRSNALLKSINKKYCSPYKFLSFTVAEFFLFIHWSTTASISYAVPVPLLNPNYILEVTLLFIDIFWISLSTSSSRQILYTSEIYIGLEFSTVGISPGFLFSNSKRDLFVKSGSSPSFIIFSKNFLLNSNHSILWFSFSKSSLKISLGIAPQPRALFLLILSIMYSISSMSTWKFVLYRLGFSSNLSEVKCFS